MPMLDYTVVVSSAALFPDSDALARVIVENADRLPDWWQLTPVYAARRRGWVWQIRDSFGTTYGYLRSGLLPLAGAELAPLIGEIGGRRGEDADA